MNSTTTYTTCGLTTGFGSLVMDLHGCLIFQGNGTQTMNDTIRTCVVACNGSVCDTTYVFFYPPIYPYGTDTILVTPPGVNIPTAPVCPTADDFPVGINNSSFYSCGLNAADNAFGTLTFNANGCASWVANSTQTDTVMTCVVKCADILVNGVMVNVCDTTRIFFLPPAVPDTVGVTPACPSCPVTVCPTGDDLTITTGSTFSTCGAPTGYTIISGPTMAGCMTFVPDPQNPRTDTAYTCVVVCNGAVCDTTYVLLYPPVTPDTQTVTPPCPTCPVTACVQVNDVDSVGATYSTCGAPAGYTLTINNGCATYTGDGTVNTGVHTCIVMCNNGKCDTTYVIIAPPVTPDTVLVSPICDTCPVNACVMMNDVDSVGATFFSCGDPVGYQTVASENGCHTYVSTIAVHQEAITCIVGCNNGLCDTTYIKITPFTTVLPIAITDFYGKGLNNNVNQLTWIVSDETDIAQYSILKSQDQQNWKTIGSMQAKGTAGKHTYQLSDNNATETNFYKLMMRDAAGKETAYPKVVYLRGSSSVNEYVNVYPNPANTTLSFEYNSISDAANVHIFISDVTGRKVREMDKVFHTGKNVLTLDLNGLSEGTYFINYQNAGNGNTGNIKFVKSKK